MASAYLTCRFEFSIASRIRCNFFKEFVCVPCIFSLMKGNVPSTTSNSCDIYAVSPTFVRVSTGLTVCHKTAKKFIS